MRWLVEASSTGNTDAQKFVVEAESWQRALQAARAQRGEEGPMSGFSIELLEEGYRAVDPVARTRFIVKRAPDDMPVTAPLAKDANSGVAPSPPAAVSSPTTKTTPAGEGSPLAAATATEKASLTPTPAPTVTESKVPPVPSSALSTKKSIPPRPSSEKNLGASSGQKKASVTTGEDVSKNRPSEKKSAPPAPASVPAAPLLPIGAAIPGLPAIKLLSSREQNPTESSPLTYREHAFAIPPGTSEDVAVKVLKGQLKIVDSHLADAKMGKLVNLAVFDVEFTGKPPRPPLATLTWKDWKGEPVIGFPRRGAAQKQPKPPSEAGAVAPSSPPPSNASAGEAAKPAWVAPSAIAPVSFPAPAAASTPPPAPAASVPPPTPVVTSASVPAPITSGSAPPAPPAPDLAALAVAAVPTKSEAPRARVSSAEGMVRTPSGRFVRGRTTGDELITALFESMHDLHFLRDALDGGQFCLALATEVLPARAALIHFFDVEKREWIVACTRGKDATRLLTLRTPEGDELLRNAARKRRAVVSSHPTSATAQRYQDLGGSRSMIIAPIMQAGRALGALEIINPLDGMPFTEDEANAMTYIAEQYAEYLGSRGIVVDRERIQASAGLR